MIEVQALVSNIPSESILGLQFQEHDTILEHQSAMRDLVEQVGQRVNLTVAHLRIGHMEGNPEVGNSEYMGHQDCPPQLVCFLWHNTGHG